MTKKERKNFIRLNGIKIVLCFFFMIAISFAWYKMIEYQGNEIVYQKKMQVASNGGVVTNYIGTIVDKKNHEIEYTKLTGFDVAWNSIDGVTANLENASSYTLSANGLYPGSKVYFKTTIENPDATAISVSVYLLGIEYSLPLNSYITFVETDPDYHIENTVDTAKIDKNTKKCSVSQIRLTENLIVEGKSSSSFYWYVEIDSGAENDCMNTNLSFKKMQLTTGV